MPTDSSVHLGRFEPGIGERINGSDLALAYRASQLRIAMETACVY